MVYVRLATIIRVDPHKTPKPKLEVRPVDPPCSVPTIKVDIFASNTTETESLVETREQSVIPEISRASISSASPERSINSLQYQHN